MLFPDIIEIELLPIQKQALLSAAPEKQASLCQKGSIAIVMNTKRPVCSLQREAAMPLCCPFIFVSSCRRGVERTLLALSHEQCLWGLLGL